MHNKQNDNGSQAPDDFAHPLKDISARDFAALGGDGVVFVREINGGDLSRFVPEIAGVPEDAEFHLVMSANGAPLLVTDGLQGVVDWLEGHPVQIVALH